MYELPDEIWDYIKDFVFDWKRTHILKYLDVIHFIDFPYNFEPVYERWTPFPPPSNTNDIIRDEYPGEVEDWMVGRPQSNLPLTSICYNPNGNNNGGWWCGYGWRRNCHI